jgi:hypothetical protein
MTDLQKVFLMYTCIYFVIQFALFMGFWVILVMLERAARIKHAKCKELVAAKRVSEQERWKTAYALYNRRCEKKNPFYLVKAN